MKMPATAMSTTDWTHVETTEHPGETGVALWHTRTFVDIRVRMVEYSSVERSCLSQINWRSKPEPPSNRHPISGDAQPTLCYFSDPSPG